MHITRIKKKKTCTMTAHSITCIGVDACRGSINEMYSYRSKKGKTEDKLREKTGMMLQAEGAAFQTTQTVHRCT